MYAEDLIKNIQEGAEVWEAECLIPTYPAGTPDKNPMFLEKRVYQGSSGRVYPHHVIDSISDEKEDRNYKVLCLENKYIFVMILPELGGRVQRALDKTNGYDFIYYNHVIKPALVGLAGPWISGGIEFNWPQHHRPSTFDPTDYEIRRNEDGSVSVVINEIENMFRTSGTAVFTIYPEKALLQIDGYLYNRTNQPQTFLWWANPAVSVNENTQSIFPPDVHAVMDHGKRDVSRFPIATGVYYKQDYSAGVDISRYKNIPVPTSYMAYHSDYDFVGGYDYGFDAGILHIADHHISPGKKQWTWGCGDFGKAWDRNLTDNDGPYIELMTGMFTDNQPDFSWLMPNEEKQFTQIFMPYKSVGEVKNATSRAVIGLKAEENRIRVSLYTSESIPVCTVHVTKDEKEILKETIAIDPVHPWEKYLPADSLPGYRVNVTDTKGNTIVSYTEPVPDDPEIPNPAQAIPAPKDVPTNEDLFLFATHLEQYRHATFLPEDYYQEGLYRDPTDYRINNAYGALLMRRGKFAEAEPYFRSAIKKITRSNPNPYDGEAFYNLGLCLEYQERFDEAYDAFFKAIWNAAWQNSGFYHLGCIAARRKDYSLAEKFSKQALIRNTHDMNTRNLLTSLLRISGRKEEAFSLLKESLEINPCDYYSLYEQSLLSQTDSPHLQASLAANPNWAIETAILYRSAGFYEDASSILSINISVHKAEDVYPLVYYYLSDCCMHDGDSASSEKYLKLAKNAKSDFCFPHRLEDINVLQQTIVRNHSDDKALYYLGCLWYDKRQYEDAVACWQKSEELNDDFPTVHRNLALAYYNKKNDHDRAMREMEKAFLLDTNDARILMELDQLRKKENVSNEKRLSDLETYYQTVLKRDDLYLEYVALQNWFGHYQRAFDLIMSRKFHPWEGGEGKVPAQYKTALIGMGKEALAQNRADDAVSLLKQALVYPHNLGEGKLAGAQDNDIYYYLGCACAALNKSDEAEQFWQKASTGLTEPAGMMYYNDQPPETIYFQGLALLALGDKDGANKRFDRLIDYGKAHLHDEVRIDYFAVSLPDLMIFDENLNQKNKVHCLFMLGLGYLGKGDNENARKALDEALSLNPNHPIAKII